ncbi:Uncharacterised protein [Mycobacteroides abscessus subsp. massiliense]|nr:Uncharacterised protein [Mycobacteroides abscessus subsp. massiliense]
MAAVQPQLIPFAAELAALSGQFSQRSGIEGICDLAAQPGDGVGDGIASHDPLPRRNSPRRIQPRQLIKARLCGLHLRAQHSRIRVRRRLPGQGIGQCLGIQPGQHRVGDQFLQRLGHHCHTSAPTVIGARRTHIPAFGGSGLQTGGREHAGLAAPAPAQPRQQVFAG